MLGDTGFYCCRNLHTYIKRNDRGLETLGSVPSPCGLPPHDSTLLVPTESGEKTTKHSCNQAIHLASNTTLHFPGTAVS